MSYTIFSPELELNFLEFWHILNKFAVSMNRNSREKILQLDEGLARAISLNIGSLPY